jgi:mercuric ion transport protein
VVLVDGSEKPDDPNFLYATEEERDVILSSWSKSRYTEKSSLIAGALSAIGASVCCVGPLVLLSLGIGGTWMGSLTAMEPYRPFFIGVTLLFLGLAFRRLYLVPQNCAPSAPCADRRNFKRQRLTFWLVAALLLGLLAVPSLASLFS